MCDMSESSWCSIGVERVETSSTLKALKSRGIVERSFWEEQMHTRVSELTNGSSQKPAGMTTRNLHMTSGWTARLICRAIIALAQAILMARLDMQLISFSNATTPKIRTITCLSSTHPKPPPLLFLPSSPLRPQT
jgi:hypothetical protein